MIELLKEMWIDARGTGKQLALGVAVAVSVPIWGIAWLLGVI